MAFKDLVAGTLNWHKTINDNNAEAETRIGSLERNLYNPNLLINTNFKVSELVNQRGQSIYNTQGYTVDMLKVEGSNVDFNMDLTGEFLKFINKNETAKDNLTYTNISFKLENIFEKGNYTVSAKIRSQTGKRINLSAFIDDRWVASRHTFSSDDWEIVKLNVNFTDYISHIVIQPQDSMVLELNYVKFEKGDIATPFVDDDKATKLLKCSRYLTKIPVGEHIRMNVGLGNNLYFNTKLPVIMRATPKIINPYEGTVFTVTPVNSVIPVTGYALSMDLYNENNILVRCFKAGNTLTDANIKMAGDMFLSAEL